MIFSTGVTLKTGLQYKVLRRQSYPKSMVVPTKSHPILNRFNLNGRFRHAVYVAPQHFVLGIASDDMLSRFDRSMSSQTDGRTDFFHQHSPRSRPTVPESSVEIATSVRHYCKHWRSIPNPNLYTKPNPTLILILSLRLTLTRNNSLTIMAHYKFVFMIMIITRRKG